MPNKVLVYFMNVRRLATQIAEITCKMVAAVFADMMRVFTQYCKLHACVDLAKFLAQKIPLL